MLASVFLAPAAVAETPTDAELQVAYCLGMWTAMNLDLVQDVQHDCARDAAPAFRKSCESDSKRLPVGQRTEQRLRDYLAAKRLSVSDPAVALASNRGRADYALTIGADRQRARGAMSAPAPVPADDARDRLDRCGKVIKALPF